MKFITRLCKTHGSTEFVLEGRGYYRCKKCRSHSVHKKRKLNKLKLVEENGGCCSICGYNRYIGALQFHHLDPSLKSFGLSQKGKTLGMDSLREEAKKCILLCANCHSEVEGGIIQIPVTH
jgi:hypothetical protein